MGTGHVMRCIALGQAWQDAGGEVHLITCCDSTAIRQRLDEEGFEVVELSEAYPESATDLEYTLETAQRHNSKWIVLDGHMLYYSAMRKMRQHYPD